MSSPDDCDQMNGNPVKSSKTSQKCLSLQAAKWHIIKCVIILVLIIASWKYGIEIFHGQPFLVTTAPKMRQLLHRAGAGRTWRGCGRGWTCSSHWSYCRPPCRPPCRTALYSSHTRLRLESERNISCRTMRPRHGRLAGKLVMLI